MSHIGRGKLRRIIDSLIVESSISRSWTPFHSRQRGNYFRSWVNDNISSEEIRRAFEGFPDNTLDRSGSHTNAYIRHAWVQFGERFLNDQSQSNNEDGRSALAWPFPGPGTAEGRDALAYWERLSLQDKRILSMMTQTFSSVLEKLSYYLVRKRKGGGGTVYPTEMRAVPEDWGFGGRHHPNALPGVYSYFSYSDGETRRLEKYWVVYGNWRPGEQLRFYLYHATTNGDGSTFISNVLSERPVVSFEAIRKSDDLVANILGKSIVSDMDIEGVNHEEENLDPGEDRSVDLAAVEN